MKQNRSEIFFSDRERERIALAVKSAETTTSGEIATMIVDDSDRYREAELAGSLFMAALVALAVAVATHHLTVWSYLPMFALFYLPARIIFRRFPALKLTFVSRGRVAEAVRIRAVRAFYEKGLYRTRHETGILIFMSLLERKVWILGDRGINARIDPASWQNMAGDLAAGVAAGKGCDALCDVIARCGDELSRHFPRRADDTNELRDELLTDARRTDNV